MIRIVFSDTETAESSFMGIFYRILKEKFNQALECVWHDVWVKFKRQVIGIRYNLIVPLTRAM